MNPEIPGYLKEIENVGWVQEIVMERFDNATELMVPTSIVYGGAIRDCIAGKELIGDLDIAITSDDFENVSKMFATNPKWIPFVKEKADQTIKSSGDLAIKFAPISGISSFITIGGKIVQLITSRYQDRDPLQRVIRVARMVDIVCCGVIMLSDGRVFEVVPGAYQDCLDGILKINKNSDTIHTDALGLRVEKLVNRGWKNTIDVAKTIKSIEEEKEKIRKKEARLAELRSKRNGSSPIGALKEHNFLFGGPNEKPVFGGFMQELTKKCIDVYFAGNPEECLRVLEGFAMAEQINMRVKQTPIGSTYFETANSEQAYKIKNRLQAHYQKRGKTKPRERMVIQVQLVNNDANEIFGAAEPAPVKIKWGTSSMATYTSSTSTSTW
jgi:hypothetical protein